MARQSLTGVNDDYIHQNDIRRYSCATCGKQPSTGDKKLLRCSKCKLERYCNTDCQKEHWKFHKHFCAKPPRMPRITPLKKGEPR
mmetsp:Transcript_27312/g.30417  ORF Transcript_27312/g.30417 Transcript_27312/m.30417 type:complete len:85 (-) Transcript_27312:351-605(-)